MHLDLVYCTKHEHFDMTAFNSKRTFEFHSMITHYATVSTIGASITTTESVTSLLNQKFKKYFSKPRSKTLKEVETNVPF